MNYKYTRWNDFEVRPSKVFGDEVPMFSPTSYQEFRGYKGVLRGLHYDHKTWKMVQALVGDIYLVVLDVREDSFTYGKWESYIISEANKMQVLVPPGFANGHYALTDCIFSYNLFYDGDFVDVDKQLVIKWNDPKFGMEWPTSTPILQKRDS